jgi:hypothetical protein
VGNLSHREREYVVSAKAVGAKTPRIMFTHILPNVFSVLVVNLASDIGSLILVESSLSFLNLGVRPPTPSWGNMLTNAQTFFTKGVHLVWRLASDCRHGAVPVPERRWPARRVRPAGVEKGGLEAVTHLPPIP